MLIPGIECSILNSYRSNSITITVKMLRCTRDSVCVRWTSRSSAMRTALRRWSISYLTRLFDLLITCVIKTVFFLNLLYSLRISDLVCGFSASRPQNGAYIFWPSSLWNARNVFVFEGSERVGSLWYVIHLAKIVMKASLTLACDKITSWAAPRYSHGPMSPQLRSRDLHEC